mmetsp:Transcript_1352/g.2907  ORF Transcript_1352/g.2907 Transcript_1352/m.2907 type:complete len:171 (+) Transcript_1352:29-541(+)
MEGAWEGATDLASPSWAEPASPRRSPIVFLDVDGVLHPIMAEDDGVLAEPQMYQLRRVVRHSGARIVLSSTWRLTNHLAHRVCSEIAFQGLNRPIGATPHLGSAGRAAEISTWLADHAELVEGERWVAIDDMPLVPDLPPARVVTTDAFQGLTREMADAALLKLGCVVST